MTLWDWTPAANNIFLSIFAVKRKKRSRRKSEKGQWETSETRKWKWMAGHFGIATGSSGSVRFAGLLLFWPGRYIRRWYLEIINNFIILQLPAFWEARVKAMENWVKECPSGTIVATDEGRKNHRYYGWMNTENFLGLDSSSIEIELACLPCTGNSSMLYVTPVVELLVLEMKNSISTGHPVHSPPRTDWPRRTSPSFTAATLFHS